LRNKPYYCAVELAVDVIGLKWQPVILAYLNEDVPATRATADNQD
jgi:DNA-binding HxlR family transcriptional regulator